MPPPWKKSKVGRISRLVADLRSPPKHGGSLVVETGFPTSLIDLIVKNRDRLKMKKKDVALEEWDPITYPSTPTASLDSLSDHASSSPADPISSSDSTSSRRSADLLVSALEIDNSKRPPTGKAIPHLDASEAENVTSFGVVRYGGAFMVTVKVLFMVILAFVTKKLALGITISTFLLLFLEFVALRVFCFLKPCPDAGMSVNSLIERVLFFVRPRRGLITGNVSVSSLNETCQSLIEEEIEHGEIDFDSLSSERRWGIYMTEDCQSHGEEIQLAEPGSHVSARRWSSVADIDLHLHERRWRSETYLYMNEGSRRRTASSKIDQAPGRKIQRVKPDSGLFGCERRSGNDSTKKIGKARNLEGLDFGATKRSCLDEGCQLQSKEIQFVESDSDLSSRGKRWGTCVTESGKVRNKEIQLVNPYLGLLSREKRWGVAASSKRGKNSEKREENVQSADIRIQKTSNGKIKSKKLLQKLIPKKFRGSKKAYDQENQSDLSSEGFGFVYLGEEKAATGEGQEQREETKCEQGESEDDEPSEVTEEGENEVDGFNDVSLVDTNADLVEGNGRKTTANYGYIFMILIVLTGLVQGRFMALFLTMVWCLLVKSVQIRRRILKIT